MWERGQDSGIASRSYLADDTQQEIVSALRSALDQAEAELAVFNDADAVPSTKGANCGLSCACVTSTDVAMLGLTPHIR